jgi:FixJ family two-component response regulator
MTGQSVASELRSTGYKGVIVGLTGHTDASVVDSFLSSGADHVFLKPIRHEEFLRVTADVLISR